ncbi:MAG: C4-dicarboxylate transporter DcuC [Rikenellaceae bacterium]|nr:C4-dicarboxylate transporter DcuC [Rikenellaceae bacterium]MCL2693402.1 C4-dicarboxylate transporter DcuC [Rikenellaceae bacterium]
MNFLSFLISPAGLGVVASLVVSVWVARLVLKKYKPQPVLFLGGIMLFFAVILINLAWGQPTNIIGNENLPPDHIMNRLKGFENPFLDIFVTIEGLFSTRVAGLGLLIMFVIGFVKYMDSIGANKALVRIGVKPLQFIRSPYLVLVLAFLLGQAMKIAITSAAGLGVLLMAAMFPILLKLGVSRAAATAVIATTGCIDLGPAAGTNIAIAEAAGILTSDGSVDMTTYFLKYQLPVAIPIIIVVAALHFVVQWWFDKKEKLRPLAAGGAATTTPESSDEQDAKVPSFYAILPLLPLMMMLVFNETVILEINKLLAILGFSYALPVRTLGLIVAILISVFFTMIIEYLRSRNGRKVFESLQVVFDGMGAAFAAVITLIVAGEIFASGLLVTGSINTLLGFAKDAGAGVVPVTLFMQGLIAIASLLMGSGDAAIFSFMSVGTVVAEHFGTEPIAVLMPMQISSSLARSFSPITAVVVAVSAIAGLSPFDVIKRTAIPMIGGLITLSIVNTILFL